MKSSSTLPARAPLPGRLGVLACEAVFLSPVVLRQLAAPCVLPCSFPCDLACSVCTVQIKVLSTFTQTAKWLQGQRNSRCSLGIRVMKMFSHLTVRGSRWAGPRGPRTPQHWHAAAGAAVARAQAGRLSLVTNERVLRPRPGHALLSAARRR